MDKQKIPKNSFRNRVGFSIVFKFSLFFVILIEGFSDQTQRFYQICFGIDRQVVLS